MKKILELNLEVYPLNVSMKTAYNYIDKAYVFFKKISPDIYAIEFEGKGENTNVDNLISEFKNDLLHEIIRKNISVETKNIRELILARALYGFALEGNAEENPKNEVTLESEDTSYKDDDENIGKSWF